MKIDEYIFEPREECHSLSVQEISEILPHRYPFQLVDRILDYEAGEWALGIKCVSINEAFFQGHFPKRPVMPGVLLIEALAQTGAIAVLTKPENRGRLVMFAGITDAVFKRQVVPGDVVTLSCKLLRQTGILGRGVAIAKVNDKVCVRAELKFAITNM